MDPIGTVNTHLSSSSRVETKAGFLAVGSGSVFLRSDPDQDPGQCRPDMRSCYDISGQYISYIDFYIQEKGKG